METDLNNAPFFSVIVNCYNGETYLKKALDSIFAQTFGDYEVIFWDNQSTDSSAEIARSYSDSRLHYLLAPNFTDVSVARNLAVKQARGEWIAFLDCDDVWLCQKLEKQHQLITEDDSAELSFIYTRTKTINEKDDWIPSTRDSQQLPEGYIMKDLLEGNCVAIASSVVRKEYFLKIGGISSHYRFCGDYYLWLALSKHWKALKNDEVFTLVRSHPNNLSHANRTKMTIESMRLRLRFDSSYSLFRFGMDLYYVSKPILKEKWFPFHGHVEQKIKGQRKLFIWGASQRGKEALHYLQENKIYPYCFIDKDPQKHEQICEGSSVENPDCLRTFSQKEKPFIVIASMFKDEIAMELNLLGYRETKDFLHFPF
jgi:glycosyltransferase involved in cell wall biosynthesis